MNISEITTFTIMGLFVPILLYRFWRLCVTYVKTGGLGNIDNAVLFRLVSSGLDDKVSGPKLKYFLTEPHPVTIFIDAATWMFAAMLIGILTVAPFVLVSFIAIILFIFVLRLLRKRYAIRQEFEARLKGEWEDE